MMGPTGRVLVPSESVAVTCSMYAPGAGKVTVATGCCDVEKVTLAGPLTWDQAMAMVPPAGSPGSVAVAV